MVAQVRSQAWEFLHAMGAAKKKKKLSFCIVYIKFSLSRYHFIVSCLFRLKLFLTKLQLLFSFDIQIVMHCCQFLQFGQEVLCSISASHDSETFHCLRPAAGYFKPIPIFFYSLDIESVTLLWSLDSF